MTKAANTTSDIDKDSEIIVGKDILELLSSSMYVNPLVIYREYVQNAVDAIDCAVAAGLLASVEKGRVDIRVDHIDRRVVVRDNGIGVSNIDFPRRMLSFGASMKRGTGARGFRGVGRLAGLGYAQALVFRSRSNGDPHVMEVTWDMHTIKRMLAISDNSIDLRAVVKEGVTLSLLGGTDYPAHFFEVEILKPRRIGNDRILNEHEISAYIRETCPCPFLPTFSHRQKIEKALNEYALLGRFYNIHMNGSTEPLYRPYRDEISYTDTKTSRIQKKLTTIEIPKADREGLAAIGWFLHHDYQGAIPAIEGVRGLRARVGNLQIGNERLLAEIFPEDRFCSWSIGEVHVLDERVIPNGRRDAFEASLHFDHIITHLRIIGAEIARECRLASQKRNRRRTIELGIDKVQEKLGVIKQGAISSQFAGTITEEIREILSEMRASADFEVFDDGERGSLKSQIESLAAEVGTSRKRTGAEKILDLPVEKRAVYREIFDLVYSCSANQVAAKNLIERILDRLPRKDDKSAR